MKFISDEGHKHQLSVLRGLTPEDTILAKLQWGKLSGGSEKQLTDALRVYELQHPSLDGAYLQEWVESLGLQAEWQRLLAEAEPPWPHL